LLVWLTFLVAGSQQRLRSAVDAQTQDLRSANDALLAQVRERVATAYDGRGRVELQSAPGQGTVIRIHLPAPNPAT